MSYYYHEDSFDFTNALKILETHSPQGSLDSTLRITTLLRPSDPLTSQLKSLYCLALVSQDEVQKLQQGIQGPS